MQIDSEIAQIVYEVIPEARERQEQYVVDTSEVDHELMEIFIEQMDMNITAITEARARGALVEVANEAHSIKGMGGTAGMPELSVLAEYLEKAARTGDAARCDELAVVMDRYFAKVREWIDAQP